MGGGGSSEGVDWEDRKQEEGLKQGWVVNMKEGIMNMLTLQLENEEFFTK